MLLSGDVANPASVRLTASTRPRRSSGSRTDSRGLSDKLSSMFKRDDHRAGLCIFKSRGSGDTNFIESAGSESVVMFEKLARKSIRAGLSELLWFNSR